MIDTPPGATLVAAPPAELGTRGERRTRLLRGALMGAVACGVVLRLWPRGPLWLDEAQAVAIARAPLTDLPSLLRQDGAPPLYYVLLHVWMQVVGDGDTALRALSLLLSTAMVAVMAVVARRLGGRTAAWCVVVLLLANPFATRYATEARMYALVALEVAIGLLVLPMVVQREDRVPPGARLGLALTTAALLWTHYWSLYLVGTVVLVLAVLAWLDPSWRKAVGRGLGAIALGGVLWLPWLPSFRFQEAHTGTPWSRPADWRDLIDIVPTLRGVSRPDAVVLAVVLVGLGLHAARRGLGRVPLSQPLLAVVLVGPLLALVGCRISESAFAGRYTSVFFAGVVLLAALGAARLPSSDLRVGILLVATLASLPISWHEATSERTPARDIASALGTWARPGDVVVFCPDQLGPSTMRALGPELADELTLGVYPDWRSPARVDWVDYAHRYAAGRPSTFAADAIRRAGDGTVWLVYSDLYPPTQPQCQGLRAAMTRLRPSVRWFLPDLPARHLDHGGLVAFRS